MTKAHDAIQNKDRTGPPPRLKDRYRLVTWLGEGGMGAVYRAHDEILNRDVAIKFLPPKQMANVETRDRFLREARVVARLSHPNIMALYDADRERDWYYLILEYIAGRDLHLIAQERDQAFPVSEALAIIRNVLEALAYAHAQGVVHRDIKPENVMVTPEGQVKVTDFGLSIAQGETRLTHENVIVGTALYLAPEVAEGAPADSRSDLYAVGAVLYELLTGQPPFVGDNPMQVISQMLTKPITRPRLLNAIIPSDLEEVVIKLLAKDPAERYPSAKNGADGLI